MKTDDAEIGVGRLTARLCERCGDVGFKTLELVGALLKLKRGK